MRLRSIVLVPLLIIGPAMLSVGCGRDRSSGCVGDQDCPVGYWCVLGECRHFVADGDAGWTDGDSDRSEDEAEQETDTLDRDDDTDADMPTDGDPDPDPDADGSGAEDESPDTGREDDSDAGQDTEQSETTDTPADGDDEQPWIQPPVWDLPMIRDPATAACSFSGERTVLKDGLLLAVWDVSYLSWEAVEGRLRPIVIRGFAARPLARPTPMPGIVHAHGLGGFAKEENATGPAALTSSFVIAYTGPGGGDGEASSADSEGLPAFHGDGRRMFDTIPDLRGTWFWGHAVAAMRGLTCLETRSEVDPDRLGITGFSAGGVISLMVAGADDRVAAAVPLSASGAWDTACLSPEAWQHDLLVRAGLDSHSPEWIRLIETFIRPAAMVGSASARVMMVNGSSDNFFPITAFRETFDALPGTDSRMSLIANFDHGCSALFGVDSPDEVEERASLRGSGAQRLWFRHWFGTDADYGRLPETPAALITLLAGAAYVTTGVDDGGSLYAVDEVRLWGSADAGYTWWDALLDTTGGVHGQMVYVGFDEGSALYFIDVTYRTRTIVPERFSLSSPVIIPPGTIARIRSMETCQ